jgi:hypothetical protein
MVADSPVPNLSMSMGSGRYANDMPGKTAVAVSCTGEPQGAGARHLEGIMIHIARRKVAARALVLCVTVLLLGTGCVKKAKIKVDQLMLPSFPMTRVEAIRRLEQISRDSQTIQNISAKVTVQATMGGVRTATMSTSPALDGTLLLQRPDRIRLRAKIALGLATAFDLVSNGEKYRFLIPEKKQLWEGLENGPPVDAISNSQMINAFVTLRPKQVQDAVLINLLPLIESSATQMPVESVPVREDRKLYYVVYFTKGNAGESRIVEKVWFDLSTEKKPVARRQTFKDNGEVDADVRYSGWDQVSGAGISIPSNIHIEFPDREILLTITVAPASAVINGKLSDGAFDLDPGNAEIKTLPTKDIASTP